MKDDLINAAGNAYKVQADQMHRLQNVMDEATVLLDELLISQDEQNKELDDLLAQAEALATDMDISLDDIDDLLNDNEMCAEADTLVELSEAELEDIPNHIFEQVHTIDAEESWEAYLHNVHTYANDFNIDLSRDPFEDLLTVYDREQIAERIKRDCTEKNANCDKLDYGFAALSGVLCAFVDIFFVKSPLENENLKKVDDITERVVLKASNWVWKSDEKKRADIQSKFQNKLISKDERNRLLNELGIPVDYCLSKGPESVDNGITYLEKRFKVVYDSVRKNDLINVYGNHLADMKPINHHIKSIAHSPDIIGWLFAVLDQFTESSTFIDGNRVIHFEKRMNGNGGYELRGNSLVEKLIAGTVNWLGHIISDISGSSSTKAENRGMGVCAPFMELLQLCPLSINNFQEDGAKKVKISDLAIELFTKGYDFRYSRLQALPVAINECFIRLFWGIRQLLQHGKNITEIVLMMNPVRPDPDLQRMLLVGHGTLCILETGEAVIAHYGDPMQIALHMNFMAWVRFAWLGYREINSIYNRKIRNIARMDRDIEEEWERLLDN